MRVRKEFPYWPSYFHRVRTGSGPDCDGQTGYYSGSSVRRTCSADETRANQIGGARHGARGRFSAVCVPIGSELHLTGWVQNSSRGICIEVEGPGRLLDRFLSRLKKEKPRLAIIQHLESLFLNRVGYKRFEIRHSNDRGTKRTAILPDIAICRDCQREIFDPNDRRYLYPFTNCTNCGPRFSIIESLPYDRSGTSMKNFRMCPACQEEYSTPANRRFHAQPNAGPPVARNLNFGTIMDRC